MKIIIFLFLLCGVFTSCSGIKLAKIFNKGELKTKEFTQLIPFTYRLGLIILPVEIEGKTYQFLLDTGAPNVISPELAGVIQHTKSFGHKANDSQGGKNELQFITLKEIVIGGIVFENTGVAIANLRQSNEVACLKIDGIIGSNLMRLCKWKIDYNQQILTISHDVKNLGYDTSFASLKFEPELTGTPIIAIDLDGQKIEHVKFDTGSVGFLDLPTSALNKAKKSGNVYEIEKSFGVNGSGLFGPGEDDTSYYAMIPTIRISSITIKNRVIEFAKGSSALLGTQFFKHFKVILDWEQNQIHFQQLKEIENKTFETFGFNVFYDNDQLLVKELFENSIARQKGLKNGDQIISINGKDISVFSKLDWCDFIESETIKKNTDMNLMIKRDNRTFEVQLAKEQKFN